MENACFICDPVNDLLNIRDYVLKEVFYLYAPDIIKLMNRAIGLAFTFLGIGMIANIIPINTIKTTAIRLILGGVIATALLKSPSGTPIIFDYIFKPLESIALNLGIKIINHFSITQIADSGHDNYYIQIISTSTESISSFIGAIYDIYAAQDRQIFTILYAIIMTIIIGTPFILYLCMLIASIIEAMLAFLWPGIFSPLLILCALFKPTRQYAVEGLKTVLSGSLLVVACSTLIALMNIPMSRTLALVIKTRHNLGIDERVQTHLPDTVIDIISKACPASDTSNACMALASNAELPFALGSEFIISLIIIGFAFLWLLLIARKVIFQWIGTQPSTSLLMVAAGATATSFAAVAAAKQFFPNHPKPNPPHRGGNSDAQTLVEQMQNGKPT